MKSKQKLGQFFTTNVGNILTGMEQCVKNKNVIDPFAGKCDLLKWATEHGAATVAGYDIDPKLINNDTVKYNDSLKTIPEHTFSLTNPPWLAKNKMPKKQKKKYLSDNTYEDFYLLAIKRIIEAKPDEGILIVPVNFLSAENSDKLRTEFFTIYKPVRVNYFRERVFEDTTYNTMAIYYVKDDDNVSRTLDITFFPENEMKSFVIEKQYSYRIGGKELNDIVNCKGKLKIKRLTEQMMKDHKGTEKIDCFFNDYDTPRPYKITRSFKKMIRHNLIALNCIDSKSDDNKISAINIKTLKKEAIVGKNTSRNIAYILINGASMEQQEKMIAVFNETLNNLRKKYNSLFLTNFRDGDRKRVSFEFCYRLLNYCYKGL